MYMYIQGYTRLVENLMDMENKIDTVMNKRFRD